MTKKVLTKFVRVAFAASVGINLASCTNAFAQLPAPAVPGGCRRQPRLRSSA